MCACIQKAFQQAQKQFSRGLAIVQKDGKQWRELTFADIGAKVEALTALLADKRVKRGDRVAIILDNCWQWPVIFFAVMSRAAIAVPVNPEATEAELNNIIKDAQINVVFAEDKLLAKKIQAKNIICINSSVFEKAVCCADVKTHILNSQEEDIACILYTSGTTDEPKGVMLTHKNLLANCDSIIKLRMTKRRDRVLAILPLHHAFALTVTMLLPIFYGFTIIYPQSLKGEDLLDAMQAENPTIFLAVPQVFSLFRQRVNENLNKIPWVALLLLRAFMKLAYSLRRITGINLTRVLLFGLHGRFGRKMRLFISGGAKLDEDIARDLFKYGFTILEGYGLTETSPVLTINPYRRPKIGSVGKALPRVSIKIVNKNSRGIGEVITQGPNIMKGYYKKQEETDAVIKNGWFYTGDLGFIDKDGYLFLTGRAKEVIVLSSGLNIFPEEIEKIYSQQAPVEEICVFEASSRIRLKEASVLWAMVVPDLEYFRKRGEVNLKTVLKERFDNVSRALPEYKRIRGFSITLEKLPRTLLGKIRRFAVKDMYHSAPKQDKTGTPEEEMLTAADKDMLQSAVGKKIIACLKKQAKTESPILPENLLELDLGLDSLGRVELASGLEKAFGIKIEDEIISNAFTVKELITGVESLVSEQGQILSEPKGPAALEDFGWKRRLEILPEKSNLDKIDLKPGFCAWLAWTVFIETVRLVLFTGFRFKVKGKENIPRQGPYILFANHTSYLDGFIIGAGMPYCVRMDLFFLGFRPYFNVPVIRNLIKIGRVIPLDFSTHLMESLRSCYYILQNNKNLCLFPEGMRSADGNLKRFKRGFGILAKETNAKLIPVCIGGAFQAWPRTSTWPRFYPLRLEFGTAITNKEAEEYGIAQGAKDRYEAICLGAEKVLLDMQRKKG